MCLFEQEAHGLTLVQEFTLKISSSLLSIQISMKYLTASVKNETNICRQIFCFTQNVLLFIFGKWIRSCLKLLHNQTNPKVTHHFPYHTDKCYSGFNCHRYASKNCIWPEWHSLCSVQDKWCWLSENFAWILIQNTLLDLFHAFLHMIDLGFCGDVCRDMLH